MIYHNSNPKPTPQQPEFTIYLKGSELEFDLYIKASTKVFQQLVNVHCSRSPKEGQRAFSGHCLGQESFASARRTIEQQARSLEAQGSQLRMLQRELDGVQDVLLNLLEPPNILPSYRRDLRLEKRVRVTLYPSTPDYTDLFQCTN